MATVIIAAKTSDSFASNKLGDGAGKMENPTPSASKPKSTPATGVRMPISNAAPAMRPTIAPSHIPGVESALYAR